MSRYFGDAKIWFLTFQIILYLNGMKKWKGRYALLSLHVMKGEYDLMLKWPCHIEGNVTLRDLENSDEEQVAYSLLKTFT